MYLHKIRRSINSSQILHFAFIFQTVVNISSEFIFTIIYGNLKIVLDLPADKEGERGEK